MNDEEESTHHQLVNAFLDYLKANDWWVRNESVRSYAAVQQATKEIKKLIIERNRQNKERFHQRTARRRAERSKNDTQK